MEFFSIISEFNPFHKGHKYLIEQTKAKTGASAIVCIMSGSMVQRGDVAIYDKWTRSRVAIENGADLVVELPVCYVLQSADVFAKGAVEIANAMGTSGISFGSETTDEELLRKMAKLKINEPPQYTESLKRALDSGLGYAAACEIAARETLGDIPKEVTSPNATLGISYIAQALKLNPEIKFHIEKRIGDYHSLDTEQKFVSATAIRQKILSGDSFSDFSLCTSDDIYDISKISSFILGFFRTSSEDAIKDISGMEPGLANRLITQSKNASSFDEFVDACTTKRYSAHRIRRVILSSLIGINSAPHPQYIRVLALNSKGKRILKDIKDKGNIEIITKITNSAKQNSKMLKQDILATDICALCCQKKASMDYFKTPFVDE